MRPVLLVRFRHAAQYAMVKAAAERNGISVNEFMVRSTESFLEAREEAVIAEHRLLLRNFDDEGNISEFEAD